jgi:hypothetical protein
MYGNSTEHEMGHRHHVYSDDNWVALPGCDSGLAFESDYQDGEGRFAKAYQTWPSPEPVWQA